MAHPPTTMQPIPYIKVITEDWWCLFFTSASLFLPCRPQNRTGLEKSKFQRRTFILNLWPATDDVIDHWCWLGPTLRSPNPGTKKWVSWLVLLGIQVGGGFLSSLNDTHMLSSPFPFLFSSITLCLCFSRGSWMAALLVMMGLSPLLAWARETHCKCTPWVVSYCSVGEERVL